MGKNALYLLNVELAAIQDVGLGERYVRFITHAVLWFRGGLGGCRVCGARQAPGSATR